MPRKYFSLLSVLVYRLKKKKNHKGSEHEIQVAMIYDECVQWLISAVFKQLTIFPLIPNQATYHLELKKTPH